VWVVLSAAKANQVPEGGDTYLRNYHGAFRIGIEEYAFPTAKYRLSSMYRTLTRALLGTLNLAINDFQDRVYGGPIDPAEGYSICFSLQLLSTSEDFLLTLANRFGGDSDGEALGMVEQQTAAMIAVLKLFVGVKGLLISEAELRQIGRADDPAEQIRLLS
jgi:hypothetical protein